MSVPGSRVCGTSTRRSFVLLRELLFQVALKLRLHVDLRGAVVPLFAIGDDERRDGDLLVARDLQLRLQRQLQLDFRHARDGGERQTGRRGRLRQRVS